MTYSHKWAARREPGDCDVESMQWRCCFNMYYILINAITKPRPTLTVALCSTNNDLWKMFGFVCFSLAVFWWLIKYWFASLKTFACSQNGFFIWNFHPTTLSFQLRDNFCVSFCVGPRQHFTEKPSSIICPRCKRIDNWQSEWNRFAHTRIGHPYLKRPRCIILY